jgi:hypothetical protein
MRLAAALNAASANGERQILPRQTNSTASFLGTSFDLRFRLMENLQPFHNAS